MPLELLIEIGTEEIPSGYIAEGTRAFGKLIETCLDEHRIRRAGDIRTYGTPRRLVAMGEGIAAKQEDAVQEITGPPRQVAYDEQGNPTKAALGFAKKQNVSLDALTTIKTERGEYVHFKRQVPGKATAAILGEALPGLLSEIPWPKSMRWDSISFPFVRPIHWVLAILGGEVIPFQVAGVKSGDRTRGHRFMAPGEKRVSGIAEYLEEAPKRFVIISQQEREDRVRRAAAQVAQAAGGTPGRDDELLATVANLVEYPSAVCGGFDEAFLTLPDAVLVTVMKEHQKYFAVHDPAGNLMNHFVAVNNTEARDEQVVCRGHERVLRARLSDARFFFDEDRKRSLGSRLDDLKGVIYQADLGTSYGKVRRFSMLARYLGNQFLPHALKEIDAAAGLCKCDLVTEMVSEFPSLQGKMGAIYAELDGHPPEICTAVREHYLPDRAGGDLPSSPVAAVVSCADRMDTITGCFAVGLEPTGSADPFALRRHALAIIRILEDRGWDLSMAAFIEKSLSILREDIDFEPARVATPVTEFFRERYRQMLLREGYEMEVIDAVISVAFDRITSLRPRVRDLKEFVRKSREFESLALTFKRVTNILKKQKERLPVHPERFCEPAESDLWQTYDSLRLEVARCLEEKRYEAALETLVGMREPVDRFFDSVEILVADRALQSNRVGLLQRVSELFLSVADLSRISI